MEREPGWDSIRITAGDVYRAAVDCLGSYVARKLCLPETDDNGALSEPVFRCPDKVEPSWRRAHESYGDIPGQQRLLMPEDNVTKPHRQDYGF